MKATLFDLTRKELSLHDRMEKIVIELLKSTGDFEIDNNNTVSHASNTCSVYLGFCMWNKTHTIEFTVRISDHLPNAECGRDIYLYTNQKYSKKELTEKIKKYLILN